MTKLMKQGSMPCILCDRVLNITVVSFLHLGIHKPQPTLFGMACKLRVAFISLNGRKNQNEDCSVICKKHEIQIPAPIVLWEYSHAHCSFVYVVSVDTFTLDQQVQVVATDCMAYRN